MFFNQKNNFLYILLLFIGSFCSAQTYNFKNYNTEQGLPQSQVLCIFQDHKGCMWFGTNAGGVGKYDGSKFTTVSENDGLINNVVFSITENHKNELLFGTSKGLSVYNGFNYKNYNEKNGLDNSWVFKLLRDGDKVWIGTQEGVYIMQNEKIRRFAFDKILDKASVFSIFIDSQKRIWFATINNGAICYNSANNSFTHYNSTNGLAQNFVFSFEETPDHEILIGTVEGIYLVNDKEQIRSCDYIPRQMYIGFRSLLTTLKHEQWFGTASDGLFKYHNKSVINFNLTNGLTFNSIMCLYSDREGNLWMGTDGSGVYKYLGDQFTSYTKQNGLTESYVNAVAQDNKGAYWVALRNNGISKIEGNHITSYRFDKKNYNAIPDDDITAILPLQDGRIFFGTRDGLCIYDNGTFKTVSDFDFRKKYILTLYQDSKKNIWIGTTVGLYKYQNGVITEAKPVNDLRQSGLEFLILSIIEDKNGSIWVGTENGAVKYDEKSVTLFNEKNNFVTKRILSSVIDSQKNLWFGTEEGIYHYDYQTFTKISQKNGLSSNSINFLQTDNKNRLIIGLNTGIDILDFTDYYNHKINV
ncbi:MAG: hypothetical protein HY062_13725, partial [Bacteroidetes bacterium]|nr:hypothetical protein [Bacteroidota bacterium]